jgi:putative membrane protein insertion efficiency factor
MKRIILGLLRFYQLALSPYWGGRCRFVPSCSAYAIDAVTRDGVWRGLWAMARRLSRCHPLGGSGWDPYPGHK